MVDQEVTVQAQFSQVQEVWASLTGSLLTAISHLKASCAFLKKNHSSKRNNSCTAPEAFLRNTYI